MSSSPDLFLLTCLALINAHPTAYPDWSENELRNHIIVSVARHCMAVRLVDDELHGLCTWEVDEQAKHIHLVGFIGNKDFIIHMRDRWRAEKPDFSVFITRRGKFRQLAKV